ncbi:hypothetical protein QJS04_geneDACA010892 [Acorus gramineus]|uniref:Myb-like domain-containing protein n=1 Tax=Acorus gramineus TaxID=55184 RepID=A0AAV9BDV7_ACOGR|nr:hypothetical protein QJS04_geneDACA010892 [Acorus gramineus]
MAEIPSPTSLAWHWVIEALADLKEVHTSLLKALIDRVPSFLTGSSEAARERVGLRCLEEWVDKDSANHDSLPCLDGPSTSAAAAEVSDQPIEMGSRSEDVLGHLVKRVAAPSTSRKYGTELSENNIHQFILQKRASLPRCFLDRLKESVPDNCNIIGTILNEHSSVTKRSRVDYLDDDLILPDSEDEHVHVKKFKRITIDGETQTSNRNSATLASGNGDELLQENITVNGRECANVRLSMSDKQKDSQCDKYSAKMQSVKQKSIYSSITKNKRIHNAAENEMGGTADPTLQKGVHVDGNEVYIYPDHIAETSSNNHGCSDAAPNGTPDTETINAEKHIFLSSQNILSQLSLFDDLTQQRNCIKCNDGGLLLSCSTSDCPVVGHESCLGSSIGLKDTECFYCPFCTCARAAAAYRKAKREAILAREALSSFIGRDEKHGHHKKQQSPGVPIEPNQNGQRIPSQIVNMHHCVGAIEKQPQKGFTIECRNSTVANLQMNGVLTGDKCNEPLIEGKVDLVNGFQYTGVEKQLEEADDAASFHSCRDNVRELNSAPSNGTRDHVEEAEKYEELQSGPESKHQKQADYDDHEKGSSSLGEEISQNHVKVSKRKSKREAEHQTPNPAGNVRRQSKDNSSSSKVRVRPAKRYTNLMHPYGRRNKLRWTPEEEEMLKEAVQKFSSSSEKGFPWTKILEYGCNVFHRTRLPADLKDKWRNITIKEGLKKETCS